MVADVVEQESVREFETEPLAIVGQPGGDGQVPRNEERLLRRHQPAPPLIQHIARNVNAENLTGHQRILQGPVVAAGGQEKGDQHPIDTCVPIPESGTS